MSSLTRWSDDYTSDELEALERSQQACDRRYEALRQNRIAEEYRQLERLSAVNQERAQDIVNDIIASEIVAQQEGA